MLVCTLLWSRFCVFLAHNHIFLVEYICIFVMHMVYEILVVVYDTQV